MNTRSILTVIALSILIPPLSTPLRAQGSLNPPAGPPVASMKTLDQVEARIPLVAGQPGVAVSAAGTITISQPGSYYLTRNVTIATADAHGIVVSSNNVSLDLNGFALFCTAVDGGDAVHIKNASSVRVHNGIIAGGSTLSGSTFSPAGWLDGVGTEGTFESNHSASDLTVSGTRFNGINLRDQGGRVERCSVHTVGGVGILASSVHFCTVLKAGRSGIGVYNSLASVVDNCLGESVSSTSSDAGISAGNATVSNSRGIATAGIGIDAREVTNSLGTSNTGVGIEANIAANCTGQSVNGSHGMNISGTASFCRGYRPGGVAIYAAIAVACTATGTITSPSKQLGTP